jgi:ferredoxin--NADP+ reductase
MTDDTSPPLRVAIVGSGPSGLYAAGQLLRSKDHTAEVDVFDRLPTPWGLVRLGVAPDHPNIKAVTRVYEKTAALPGFRFYGNVEVGRDITAEELHERYHAVLYAYGAASDRRLGIDGEDLPGSWAATEFVAWYNGHPDFRDLEFDLSSCERAVVVGNGNVAADVARMLSLTDEELRVTDVADHALAALRDSAITEIVVLGRRGPAQAAFTNPEVLELGELEDADVIVDPADMQLDPASEAWLAGEEAGMTERKNVEILRGYSERVPEGRRKRLVLRFLTSPVEILGEDRVEGVVVERNELVEDGGSLRAKPTGERETIPAGLIFRSVGYRGLPLPGASFDERRATIPNDRGRVLAEPGGDPVPGAYVVGWIKRGPSGIIGTNKKDAQETVTTLLEDLASGAVPAPALPDRSSIEDLLAERRPHHVTFAGWEAIDATEKAAGEPQGRPRVKLCRWDELLDAAGVQVPDDGAGIAEAADSEDAVRGTPVTEPSESLRAVTGYLDEHGISYEVVEHAQTADAAGEAAAVGFPASHAAKTVVLRDGDRLRLAVLPASEDLDLAKARGILGGGDLRLAEDADVASLGPFEPGALPPLATLLPAPEVLDRRLLEHDRILIPGGDHRHGVLIDPNDLVEIVQPEVGDVSSGDPALQDVGRREL